MNESSIDECSGFNVAIDMFGIDTKEKMRINLVIGSATDNLKNKINIDLLEKKDARMIKSLLFLSLTTVFSHQSVFSVKHCCTDHLDKFYPRSISYEVNKATMD